MVGTSGNQQIFMKYLIRATYCARYKGKLAMRKKRERWGEEIRKQTQYSEFVVY